MYSSYFTNKKNPVNKFKILQYSHKSIGIEYISISDSSEQNMIGTYIYIYDSLKYRCYLT